MAKLAQGLSPEGVAVITGNTTMLHLASGLDPRSLSLAPFSGRTRRGSRPPRRRSPGGFGSWMDPASAERIGLLPEGLSGRTVSIGNAAGTGACRILQSAGLAEDPRHFFRRGGIN